MISAAELLDRGVSALIRADAEELTRLASLAERTAKPDGGPDTLAAGQKLRILGRLLPLTERNLRLLRGRNGWQRKQD
jgi:hypothetical protein